MNIIEKYLPMDKIRTIECANGKVMYAGADVMNYFGYKNHRYSLKQLCYPGGVGTKMVKIPVKSGYRGMRSKTKFIDERNIIRIIMLSRKEKAKKIRTPLMKELSKRSESYEVG